MDRKLGFLDGNPKGNAVNKSMNTSLSKNKIRTSYHQNIEEVDQKQPLNADKTGNNTPRESK